MKLSRVPMNLLALLAIVAAVLSVPVSAQNGKPASVEERIKGAQKVVVATAFSVNPTWHETSHGDRIIVSRIALQVEETLKGRAATTEQMDLEGGTLDGFTLKVSDLPEIKPGDRAVFFLDSTDTAVTRPHGRGQGILKLDSNNIVRGSSLDLETIRRAASSVAN